MVNEKTILCLVIWTIFTIILISIVHRGKHPIRPHLAFFFKYKNHNHMQIVSSLTLTSLLPQILLLAVIDQNNSNSVIPGKLSNIVVTPADPAQDSADSDGTGNVTVDALVPTGGTTVSATADFVSDKVLPDGVTPVVSGNFSVVLTLVNNVVVSAALAFTKQ